MDNQGKLLTTDEVIQETIRLLGSIAVPVGLNDQIATPIKGAIQNLTIVRQMMETERKNRNQAEDETGTWLEEDLTDSGEAEANG